MVRENLETLYLTCRNFHGFFFKIWSIFWTKSGNFLFQNINFLKKVFLSIHFSKQLEKKIYSRIFPFPKYQNIDFWNTLWKRKIFPVCPIFLFQKGPKIEPKNTRNSYLKKLNNWNFGSPHIPWLFLPLFLLFIFFSSILNWNKI